MSGQKVWTSRAEYSDLMLLLARTSERQTGKGQDRSFGLSVFLLDMREAKKKGLTIRPIRTMINHSTTEVFFDDVVVPAASLIGEEGKGFGYILQGMNAERILIAAECIGDGRFFLDRACAYANQREVFGRKIGANQGIQFPLAKGLLLFAGCPPPPCFESHPPFLGIAYAALEAANLMVQKAASLYDHGEKCGAEANMAKHLGKKKKTHPDQTPEDL